MVREPNDGTWSNPAFYFLAAGSIGLQAGGQVSEVIFTLMTDNAVRAMIDDEFKFGGDISVAVAHKGAGMEASSSSDLEVDITKQRKPARDPAASPQPASRLLPSRPMSLEQALEFLGADELVEITPRDLRIRKKMLVASQRGRKA